MAIVDDLGLPISVDVTSGSPHESKLVDSTIKVRFSNYCPQKIIGDKTWQWSLRSRVTERWKVYRFFAWPDGFKRTITRYEVNKEFRLLKPGLKKWKKRPITDPFMIYTILRIIYYLLIVSKLHPKEDSFINPLHFTSIIFLAFPIRAWSRWQS